MTVVAFIVVVFVTVRVPPTVTLPGNERAALEAPSVATLGRDVGRSPSVIVSKIIALGVLLTCRNLLAAPVKLAGVSVSPTIVVAPTLSPSMSISAVSPEGVCCCILVWILADWRKLHTGWAEDRLADISHTVNCQLSFPIDRVVVVHGG